MKNLNIGKVLDKTVRAVKSVDLLDGQRRGEVIARRVFVLIVGFLAMYLLLHLFVGEKDRIQEVEAKTWYTYEEATGKEFVQPSFEVEQVETAVKVESITEDSVSKFIASYGGKIDGEYLGYLRIYCNDETLKSVVAISVAETGMGKATKKVTNFYGWYPNGNRKYDPSKEEMAKTICTGVSKYYSGVGASEGLAKKYTGGDSTSTWLKNYNWALSKMK